jgi:hypothetical protein
VKPTSARAAVNIAVAPIKMEGLRFIGEFCSVMHEMNLRFSHSCPPPNDGEPADYGFRSLSLIRSRSKEIGRSR